MATRNMMSRPPKPRCCDRCATLKVMQAAITTLVDCLTTLAAEPCVHEGGDGDAIALATFAAPRDHTVNPVFDGLGGSQEEMAADDAEYRRVVGLSLDGAITSGHRHRASCYDDAGPGRGGVSLICGLSEGDTEPLVAPTLHPTEAISIGPGKLLPGDAIPADMLLGQKRAAAERYRANCAATAHPRYEITPEDVAAILNGSDTDSDLTGAITTDEACS